MQKLLKYVQIVTVICLIILYLSQITNLEYTFDDYLYLQQIENIKDWSDLVNIKEIPFAESDFRPVATLSFALEKLIFQTQDPSISHLINFFLYLIISFLTAYLTYKSKIKDYKLISYLTFIIFFVISLHVSMYSSVKNRDGLLSCMFGLLYLHFLIKMNVESGIVKKILFLSFSIFFILLSIYSKLDGFNFLIATPLLILLTNKEFTPKFILKTVLRFVLSTAIIYKIYTLLFLSFIHNRNQAYGYESNDHLLFVENPIRLYDSLFTKVLYSISTIFEYIKMVFRPNDHFFYYGYDMIPVTTSLTPSIIIKTLIIILILLLSIFFMRKNRVITISILFFFTSLIYCSNLILPVAGIVADRYAFIASIGAVIGLSCIILYIINAIQSKYGEKVKKEFIVLGISFMAIGFYTPFNIVRAKQWKDYLTLIESDLSKIGKRSYEANRIASELYFFTALDSKDAFEKNHLLRKSIDYAHQGNEIYPGDAKLFEGIAISYMQMGLNDSSIFMAKKILEKFEFSETAWGLLSDHYFYQGNLDSAIIAYENIIQNQPSDNDVFYRYTNTLRLNGQTEKAIAFCDTLIQKDTLGYVPNEAVAYVYLFNKDTAQAALHFEQAFKKGFRNNEILNFVGQYWNSKNINKWEELRKYQ